MGGFPVAARAAAAFAACLAFLSCAGPGADEPGAGAESGRPQGGASGAVFGSSGAVCVPSRAMVLTGRSWMRSPNNMQGVPTLPRLLEAAG